MADLIAQGKEAQQRWRRVLPQGVRIVLGREVGSWAVPWDPHVSRKHAALRWTGDELDVSKFRDAPNPIFFRGKAAERFTLLPGEHFVIGDTKFTLADQRVNLTVDAPRPIQQQSFSPQYLRQLPFRNPDHRIEVLSRLPEALSAATSQPELCVAVLSMLLAGIPRADAAAVVRVDPVGRPSRPTSVDQNARPAEDVGQGAASTGVVGRDARPTVRVIHWDQRLVSGEDFQPSQRLILEAARLGQSVLHVWQGTESGPQPFTVRGDTDWAFSTPVPGNAYPGWGFYVAGRLRFDPSSGAGSTDPADPREDVKFAELVAATMSSLGQMRLLERQQASLSQFFSPVVLQTLSVEDPDIVLAPRQTEVSVLFCDLRGFSLHTERHADDLLELLNRVSKALGVMTHQILDTGGVVGDFQGDAAMGFWGWPLKQDDAVLRTCRAALGIRAEFERAAGDARSPLAAFHVGIGIATGNAVAGKIGTEDQAKVTVFGPVVNLASRLEGMTKILRAPILLDKTTAEAVRRDVPRDVARVRRLAVVRPYGLDAPLEVSELVPPESECPLLTDEHLCYCDAAVEALVAGRWSEAFELLHRTPTQDRTTDFLTVFIAQHNRTPPENWDGVIPLSSK